VTGRHLAEVAEAAATGTVAETYEEIRRTLGLPLVNFVYRHLAATPGRLEATWQELRPNLAHPATEAAARELAAAAPPGVLPIPVAALAAAGLAREELGRASATLDAYAHANPRNLLAINALLAPPEGARRREEAGVGEVEAPAVGPILPMCDLQALDPTVRSLLEEMSVPVSGPGEDVLVPGLLRHFAHNACLLALLWTAVRGPMENGSMAALAEAVGSRARERAAELPYPVRPLADEGARAVLERFAGAMARMIVVGAMLRAALEEALEGAVRVPRPGGWNAEDAA
jgi:hypothetical protein